jgi:very-short-patch-repair endonuclease
MVWSIILIVCLAILSALIKAKSPVKPTAGPWPLEPTNPLTPVEQTLYWRLVASLPDHVVLAQVQLSRFMVVKRVDKAQAWRNKIDRKSVDFLICSKSFGVVAAIELDDASHDRADRKKAVQDKDAALRSAAVRLIRWNTKRLPDSAAIRSSVLGIGPPAAG